MQRPSNQGDVVIRKADRSDVPAVAELVERFARRNDVLPRSASNIISTLRDFYVADVDGAIAGCVALAIIDDDLVEVRTLVVDEATQGLGLGRRLVEACIGEATSLGFTTVFALTRVDGFFAKLGFERCPMSALPQKVWMDCVHCPSFPNCDEIAMIRKI